MQINSWYTKKCLTFGIWGFLYVSFLVVNAPWTHFFSLKTPRIYILTKFIHDEQFSNLSLPPEKSSRCLWTEVRLLVIKPHSLIIMNYYWWSQYIIAGRDWKRWKRIVQSLHSSLLSRDFKPQIETQWNRKETYRNCVS